MRFPLFPAKIAAAVIHDPTADDSAMALRGEGAWMGSADSTSRDLRVAPAVATGQMNGMASWQYFPEPMRSTLPGRFPAFLEVGSLRCCGQEYRLAAAGRLQFLLYGVLNPWDHAPGVLLYSEAGGHARLLDGRPYSPTGRPAGLLCAPDEASWQEIRSILLD